MTLHTPYQWRCPNCREIGLHLRFRPEPGGGIKIGEIQYSDGRTPKVPITCERCSARVPDYMARVSEHVLITYKEFVDLIEG